MPGQLLFQAQRSAVGAYAHGARGIEPHDGVLWALSNGDGLRLNLWRVHRQRRFPLDVCMNCSGIESDGQRTPGFENGKMGGAANYDLAAFHQLNACGAGLNAHIAAAAQYGNDLAVDGFHAHRPGHRNGLAVNGTHGIAGRGIVGQRGIRPSTATIVILRPPKKSPATRALLLNHNANAFTSSAASGCEPAANLLSCELPKNAPRQHSRNSLGLYYTTMATPQQIEVREVNRSGSNRLTTRNHAILVNLHYDTRLPHLPWSRRIQIPIIAAAVYTVIRALGRTLRYEVLGLQHLERVYAPDAACIFAFWHRVIIPIVWWARNRGIVVLNTTAFDGQWTRKVIEWLGFGTAQGSSTRGGLRGLAVMAKRLGQDVDCGFTIDGPRGPRYVAKPGPVMLARKTGCPIVVFHVGVDRGKTFANTWDHFLLPAPFARAVILFAPPIYVPIDADAGLMEAKHAEMQRRARTRPRHCGGLVSAERSGTPAPSRRICGLTRLETADNMWYNLARKSLTSAVFSARKLHLYVHFLPAAIQRHRHHIPRPLTIQNLIHVELIRNRLCHRSK